MGKPKQIERVDFQRASEILLDWIGHPIAVDVVTTDPTMVVASSSGTLGLAPSLSGVLGNEPVLDESTAQYIKDAGEVRFVILEHPRTTFSLYRSRFLEGDYNPRLQALHLAFGGSSPGASFAETVILEIRGPPA